MTARSADVLREQSALMVATRRGDRAKAEEHRTALRAYKIRDHIRRLVDDAPPLTAEQRAMLVALFASPPDTAVPTDTEGAA